MQVPVAHIFEQKKHADRNQHCRTHQLACTAAVARTRESAASEQAPMFGKQPDPEEDQNKRPETMQPELEDANRVQKEDHTQSDQNHGSGGNLRRVYPFAHAKGLRQAERIWWRLSELNR